MSFMLSLKGLLIRSVSEFIASLGVCSRDTIIAEYDVVRKSDNKRRNRNTILEDMLLGERGEPGMENSQNNI